jgi:nucleoside-diphosphate-sugar epimerase
MKDNNEVVVLIGAGAIGIAIARRISAGKHILLSDINSQNNEAAAKTLTEAGFVVSTSIIDVCSRTSVNELAEKAITIGSVVNLIHAAGVSPSQASPEKILRVDLYGTALVLEIFGNIIAQGGSGIVIASQSGHRLPALTVEEDKALAITPVEELLKIPLLNIEKVKDSLHAYQLSKRGNSLRVRAEAVRWGKRGARINAISPGIIITPLAKDELNGPRGEIYRKMISASAAGRAGTPDEVGALAALLMSETGAFITGSDILIDGGATAACFYGSLGS